MFRLYCQGCRCCWWYRYKLGFGEHATVVGSPVDGVGVVAVLLVLGVCDCFRVVVVVVVVVAVVVVAAAVMVVVVVVVVVVRRIGSGSGSRS